MKARAVNRRDLIAFTVSGRRLALPLAGVSRAVALPRLEVPAGAPAFLEGFFDLRGSEVAVLRADRLLDLGEFAEDLQGRRVAGRSEDRDRLPRGRLPWRCAPIPPDPHPPR